MLQSILIEPHYWGSVSYFQQLLKAETIVLDVHSHFKKGTYRNRCHIMGPNGMLSLSVPLVKGKEQHSVIGDVRISYTENWVKDHWQSLVSSYRRSAYFEFYEEDIAPLYENKFDKLVDLNVVAINLIQKLLNRKINLQYSEKYIVPGDFDGLDLRDCIRPQIEKMGIPPLDLPYTQVFMDRMAFLPNLSILDALFNLGPRTLDYLEQ
ncbi:MAG: WbqC family protein [Chitinophagales bacterium]|nr:WbqC family protein [Chitinophagales bacterium]MCZ2392578.1 WbqC family protein [Chitinophagales bacterium]